MEIEVQKAIDDLSNRISHQEYLHRNIDATPSGFIHGVVTNLPVIIVSMALSAIITISIIKYYKIK